MKNLHLGIRQIAEKIAEGGEKNTILDLCGLQMAVTYTSILADLAIRFGMYYRFAGFLSNALHVLNLLLFRKEIC